jgi:glutaredoxin
MRNKLKIILPLLLLIYIAVDTFLKSRGIEICQATGCKLAGELLKFNSTYLNYLGMFGAFVLFTLALLRFDKLYTITAAAMVIFESLLIASQLNINPEPCIFCLGVYTFLLLILLNSNYKVLLYSIPAILSIFIAFSLLAIPKNKTLITKDGLYLIASKTCPHCKKTKEFLNKEGIKYTIIKASDTNAYSFAKTLGIKKIPIAIEAKNGSYQITVGDEAIIEKYGKKSNSENKQSQINPSQESFKPKLNLSGNSGCELSYQETSCEDDSKTSK